MKNLFNLLGIILISVSIVSCGGEENNESIEPSINQDEKLEKDKEYPYNVEWVSNVSSGDIKIILRKEAECEEIRGMANKFDNYEEWKEMMTKMCKNRTNIE
jgi:hypothetical protein